MAEPPGVGAGSRGLVESRAGPGSWEEQEWETGASGAVRERGHAGLAALTEAGDTAMQGTAGSGS